VLVLIVGVVDWEMLTGAQ